MALYCFSISSNPSMGSISIKKCCLSSIFFSPSPVLIPVSLCAFFKRDWYAFSKGFPIRWAICLPISNAVNSSLLRSRSRSVKSGSVNIYELILLSKVMEKPDSFRSFISLKIFRGEVLNFSARESELHFSLLSTMRSIERSLCNFLFLSENLFDFRFITQSFIIKIRVGIFYSTRAFLTRVMINYLLTTLLHKVNNVVKCVLLCHSDRFCKRPWLVYVSL